MRKILGFIVAVCLLTVGVNFFSQRIIAKDSPFTTPFSPPSSTIEDFSLATPQPYTIIGQDSTGQPAQNNSNTSGNVLSQQTVKTSAGVSNYFSVLSRVSFFVILILSAAVLVEVLVMSGKIKKKTPAVNISVAAVASTPVANNQVSDIPNPNNTTSNMSQPLPTPTNLSNSSVSPTAVPAIVPNAPQQQPPAGSVVSAPLASLPPLPKKKMDSKTIGMILFILFLLITIPLALFLVKQRQEIRKKAEAQPTVGVTCIGREVGGNSCSENNKQFYGLYVVHKFDSETACNYCKDHQNEAGCQGASLVGQLDTCGKSATCTPIGQCTANTSDGAHCVCGFSQNIPNCSVVQIDCLNDPYPPGGGINNGIIAWNCSGPCGEVTVTPTPTTPVNTPTPTIPLNTPTPTTTGQPTATPTPTGNPTSTPTPTGQPTATPTVTLTPTPTNVPGCGEKQCTTNADCPGNFPYCYDRPSDNIAVKVCIKNTAWYDGCNPPGESTPTPTQIAQAAPTIAVPKIPEAAFEAPAVLSVVGGIILLILGVLL